VLPANKIQALPAGAPVRNVDLPVPHPRSRHCRTHCDNLIQDVGSTPFSTVIDHRLSSAHAEASPKKETATDPLYLFACHMDWESSEEPSAAWELIAAAQSSNADTRSQARALLASSRHLGGTGSNGTESGSSQLTRVDDEEDEEMKGPYGLEINEACFGCTGIKSGFFCQFSQPVLEALDQVSHKTTLPSGAILFVEGQASRGLFMVCSGKVNLSTTSREGKTLILKTAGPGEALGVSAAVSGMPYETTAETAGPCQLTFVERKHFVELMQTYSEVGVHAAECLSREYRSAYRDIHDLVLTRSSSGKLARLLLSQTVKAGRQFEKGAIIPMTHEEMAMRIGSSRETVTRLLSELRRKRLISLDGPTLVIRNRSGLEALAV